MTMGRRPILSGRNSRGQSLVEFALVFPLVMLLFMMVFDFGRAIYTLNSVGNAARMGMRTAIVDQYAPNIRQRAADQATALGIDASAVGCSGSPATPTTASGVCIQYRTADLSADCSGSLGVGCIAYVTVKSTYTPLTPIIGQILSAIPIVSTSMQPIESVCTTSGCPVP